MKTNRKFAAFLTAVAASTVSAMALTWDDAGPTNNWSTDAGDTNWTGGVTWTNASAADFNASGTDTITLTTAAMTAGTVTFGASSAYIIDTGANNMTWSALAGAGGFTKAGSGTITIGGGGAGSGAVTISAGTLIASAGNSFGTSPLTLNNASTGASNTALLLDNVTVNRPITIANQGSGTATLGANGSAALPEFSGLITLAKDVTLDGGTTSDRLTFVGGIGGTGNVTIANTGRVMFRAVANTFTGNLTVNNGSVLQLNWGTSDTTSYIPDASVVTVDGTLKFAKGNNSETIGGLSGNGTVQGHEGVPNAASGLVINAAGSSAFSGTLSNGGAAGSTLSLTKTGAGTQTLSGANTYTAATNINVGTLALSGSGSLASSTITVASGAFFDVSGLAGGFTLGTTQTLRGEGTVTGSVSTDVAGGGIITAGNGTSGSLAITGALTFNGAADVNIGTLSNYTSAAAISVGTAVTITGAAGDVFINLPTASVSAGTYHLISHANVLPNLDGFTLNTQPVLGARQVGNLVNNAGFIDYVVTGANPVWTGALNSSWTTVPQTAPKNWTLPGGGTTDYLEGDIVTFNDSAVSTTVNLALDVNPLSASFDHTTKNYTLQSTGGFGITNGSLTKAGTGILTITNANNFSADATLSAGTIRVGDDSALGANNNLVLNGGTLSSNSTTARTLDNPAVSIGGDVTLGNATDNGAITLNGTVDLTAGTRVLTTASDATLDASITNGSLTKDGAGTLTLSGANSYAATTINAGTLNVGDGGVSGSLGTGTTTNNSALVVDRSDALSIGGAINGTGSLTVNGGGTLTLSGSNAYNGTTTINGSTVVLSMGPTYNISHVGSAVTINSGGVLRLTQPHATGFAYSFANAEATNMTINPGGTFDRNGQDTYIQGLTMTGNSVVTGGAGLRLCADLTATSDGTGAPTINNMALVGGTYTNAGNTHTVTVNDGPATDDLTVGVIDEVTQAGATNLIKAGNGTLTLTGANIFTGTTTATAGTLKGATSFTGPLVVQGGATVAPGGSIGTLSAGATTLAGTYLCEVDATTSDVLAVTGALDLTGATLTLSGVPAAATYTIATYTGTLTGTFAGLAEGATVVPGYTITYATANQINLVGAAGYSSWASANGTSQTIDLDHDNDGVSNGVEYFLGGTGNTTGFTALPGVVTTAGVRTVTWTKAGTYNGAYPTDFVVETSETLAGTWAVETLGVNVVIVGNNVTYTFPAGPVKKFARLKVTGP